ncbi:hypothetical protein ES703_24636 [subsurface metagenome]
MTKSQSRLQGFAESKCLPYLLNLPSFKPYLERLSFILVGSVATGFCSEDSDIDIAIVCDEETYRAISKDTLWDAGRPSETEVNGVKLHYYAIRFNNVESKLRELDDVYLYVYSNAVVLQDAGNQYTRRFSRLTSHVSEVRKQRLEGKLDMLIRRSRALKFALAEKDILSIGRICLELIILCLKVIALLDNIPFDPRKRLFTTALKGRIGQQVEDKIRQLFSRLGTLGQLRKDSDFASFAFPDKLKEIIAILSKEASKQGFRVGLESPDKRHVEK